MRGSIILTQNEIIRLYKTIREWNDKTALLRYYSDKINMTSEDLDKRI